jgi:methylphosphotriester-DNA--protein-cysteine methyltransferase
VIVVSGVPRYHRPGCILIRFLSENDVETTTREAAEAASCVPCRACQPDKLPSAAESGTLG